MSTLLGKKYTRWQTWLENPIRLDDFSEESTNVMLEMANQYIEENEDSLGNVLEMLENY